MHNPAFCEAELEAAPQRAGMFRQAPRFQYPVPPRQGVEAMFKREPIWTITGPEETLFSPICVPDNVARSLVFEARPFDPNTGGGKDMFGIEWEYVAASGGSMVRPGKPFMDDAGEWYDKLVWPDPDSWDWEGTAKANQEYLSTDKYICMWFLTGWYERLISFMDFEGAVLAMADEDQQDAVAELFDKLSDLYIHIFKNALDLMPQIDGFCIHDDWAGSQDTFFRPSIVEQLIVPPMRRVTDYLHSRGKTCELHSCGQNYKQVPNMIKAGWDRWNPQPMNDTYGLYDQYGDKLLIGIMPKMSTAAEADEATQRAEARAFAEHFFADPSKPCFINKTAAREMTPAFAEELYRLSRLAYCGN